MWYSGSVGLISSLGIMDYLLHYIRQNKFPFSGIVSLLTGRTPLLVQSEPQPSQPSLPPQQSEQPEAPQDDQPQDEQPLPATQRESTDMTSSTSGSFDTSSWSYGSGFKFNIGNLKDRCPFVPLLIPVLLFVVIARWVMLRAFSLPEDDEDLYVPDVNPYTLAYAGVTFGTVTVLLGCCGRRSIFIWETLKFKHIIASRYWEED